MVVSFQRDERADEKSLQSDGGSDETPLQRPTLSEHPKALLFQRRTSNFLILQNEENTWCHVHMVSRTRLCVKCMFINIYIYTHIYIYACISYTWCHEGDKMYLYVVRMYIHIYQRVHLCIVDIMSRKRYSAHEQDLLPRAKWETPTNEILSRIKTLVGISPLTRGSRSCS